MSAPMTPKEAVALHNRVKSETRIPDIQINGLSLHRLHWLYETVREFAAMTDRTVESDGPFSEVLEGLRVVYQPGAIFDCFTLWAERQKDRCVQAIEAIKPNGSIDQSFRLEILLPHYIHGEDWEKVAQLVADVAPGGAGLRDAGTAVEGCDRLDDGINLLHTAWVAMAGDTFEANKLSKDTEAVTDVLWQALGKLETAKGKLAQARGVSA